MEKGIKNQPISIVLLTNMDGTILNILSYYTNLTQEEAILKEKELIQFLDATNPEKGYNLSPGGQTGPKDFTKIKESSQ